MTLQGAVLLASRAARYRLSLTGTPLAADDMVREAQTRLAFHIGLDWRCATQPDTFADDIQSVRPLTRQAFLLREVGLAVGIQLAQDVVNQLLGQDLCLEPLLLCLLVLPL